MPWTRAGSATWAHAILLPALLFAMTTALSDDRHLSAEQLRELMLEAESESRTGLARKTQTVDVRSARRGEVVITRIAGEGKETQSQPAESGDFVVRNRCERTGNEEYLVKAAKFPERYTLDETGVSTAGSDAWFPATPRGKTLRYFIVRDADGAFTFDAPWGERMVARPGDAIVQDLNDLSDIYRVAAESFRCTYEIVAAPEGCRL